MCIADGALSQKRYWISNVRFPLLQLTQIYNGLCSWKKSGSTEYFASDNLLPGMRVRCILWNNVPKNLTALIRE